MREKMDAKQPKLTEYILNKIVHNENAYHQRM